MIGALVWLGMADAAVADATTPPESESSDTTSGVFSDAQASAGNVSVQAGVNGRTPAKPTAPGKSSTSKKAIGFGETAAFSNSGGGAPATAYCDSVTAPANDPCAPLGQPAAAPAPVLGSVPAVVDPSVVARQAMAQLKLPEVNVQLGPDPSVNPWNIVAVGYPIWLWADSADQVSTSVTEQGITVTIVARRTGATFDMGNGDVIRCASMTPYKPTGAVPPPESPDCGYRYPRLPAKEGAGFTMTATTQWAVTWTAVGQTGVMNLDRSQTRQMPVAELQSVVVRSGR